MKWADQQWEGEQENVSVSQTGRFSPAHKHTRALTYGQIKPTASVNLRKGGFKMNGEMAVKRFSDVTFPINNNAYTVSHICTHININV